MSTNKGGKTNQKQEKTQQKTSTPATRGSPATQKVTASSPVGNKKFENKGKVQSQPRTPKASPAGLNDAEEQQKIKELEEKMQALTKERIVIEDKIKKIEDRKAGLNQIRDTLDQKVSDTKKWRGELEAAFDAKKTHFAEIREITENLPHPWRPKEESVEAFLVANNSKLKTEIEDLSSEIQNCRSVKDQKILINRKDKATTKLKNLEKFKDAQAGLQAADIEIARLKPLLDNEKVAKDKLFQEKNAEQDKRKELKALIERKKAISEEKTKLYLEIKEVGKLVDQKWSAWKKDREKARVDTILEEQKVIPYKLEVETTKKVLKYLKGLKVDEIEESTLKHSLNVYSQFDFISLAPPKTKDDIATSIAAVKQREKEYLDILVKYRARFGIPEEVKVNKKKEKKEAGENKKEQPTEEVAAKNEESEETAEPVAEPVPEPVPAESEEPVDN